MRTRKEILASWGRFAATRPKTVLIIAVVLTAIAAVGIAFLRLELTFYSFMPKNAPVTRDLQTIIEDFPSASTIVAVVSADEKSVRDAADAVAAAFTEFSDHIVRIESRFDDSFFIDNALLLIEPKQLKPLRLLLSTTAMRLKATRNRETGAAGGAVESTAIIDIRDLLRIFGPSTFGTMGDDGYYLNDSGDKALVFAQPSFTINDFGIYGKVIPAMERAAKAAANRYGGDTGLTGLIVVGKDEMVTSQQGLEVSMAIALVLILTLLIAALKMWAVPIISGVPLLLGVFWTAGAAGLLLGRLNIMSAMYMVALVGLGVDYAIHLITAYRQHRILGIARIDAIAASVSVTGSGIITGALTSAIAFFALVVANSELVRELGVIAGIGILCELIAMFLLVPALLGMRAKRLGKKTGEDDVLPTPTAAPTAATGSNGATAAPSPAEAQSAVSSTGARSGRRYGVASALTAIAVTVAATAVLGAFAPNVEVESNIMNMEAKGLESVELQDLMVEEFDMAPDTLAIIASNVDEARTLTEKLDEFDTVSAVDSVAYYLPSGEDKELRSEEIAKLRTLFVQILEDPDSPLAPLARSLLPLTDRDELGAADLPDSIRSMYFAADSERNLVTIIPANNLWEQKDRARIMEDVNQITDRATGMVLAGDVMTQIARRDGVRAAIAALIAIFLLLLIDFRNLTVAILTLVPLAASFLSLFGIMAIAGIKFDFVNIIAVPLLIGIGIDDAVHVSHRYVLEGKGGIGKTVRLTGRAILLTTLTTIIGFASFIPSVMQAMKSTGIVLSIAMALAFVYSILLHPALLYLARETFGLPLEPLKFRAFRR